MSFRRVAFVVSLLLGSMYGARPASPAPPPPGEVSAPAVSLPAGATLEEALTAVRQATGSVVIAEKPLVSHRLEEAIRARPLTEALATLTRAYHLRGVRRGRSVVFLRQLVDPRETLNLEREEIEDVLRDLYQLIHPLNPYGEQLHGHDMRAFYQGLSAQQIEAMQANGLPYGGLSDAQKGLWGKLTAGKAFATSDQKLSEAMDLFGGWRRASLNLLRLDTKEGPRTTFFVQYPSRLGTSGWVRHEVYSSVNEPPAMVGPQSALAERSEEGTRLPSSFSRKVTLGGGATTLPELTAAVGSAVGSELAIPAYARDRRLLAWVDGATGGEVLQALTDLYGWRLAPKTGRRYSFRRPAFGPARGIGELHAQLRFLVPPTAHPLLRDDSKTAAATLLRTHREVSELTTAVARRKEANPFPATVGELDGASQRRLANLLFEQFLWEAREHLARPEPRGWLATPEAGVFHLRGEVGPGKKPLLEFRVTRPQGNGFAYDLWGWYVNTEKLDK